MKFGEILDDLVENGGKARCKEWADDRIYIIFVDERLMILSMEDNLLHPLIITIGDVCAIDWEKFKLKVIPFNKKG